MENANPPGVRQLLLTFLVLASIFLISIYRLQPPSPKPAGARPDDFSAMRAMQVLGRILGKAQPHPIGTTANAEVRANIVTELKKLGYAPQLQAAFTCDGASTCGNASNIFARLDNAGGESDDQGAVLLCAHYDSVPAGPGASDDGTGVAALIEIARALKTVPKPRHPIFILIDDGEESGLLGARAFVNSSPWARNVRAVVNLDARGTSGPSLMFETGSANQWVVNMFAHSSARPVTSSIFYTAYKQLPNDTDFTIFKAAGYQGLNFAFIGDVFRYHTPLDNQINIDAGTLQQQGDNAFSSVLAMANTDLSNPPKSEAVFFDLFAHTIMRWPADAALKLAIIFDVLLFAEIAWLFWRGIVNRNHLVWGIGGWFFILVVTVALAFLMETLIRLTGAIPVNWVAHPLPIEIAFWVLAMAVVVTSADFFASRAGIEGIWCGVWICWAVAIFFVSWLAPGVSFVLLLPTAAAGLSGLTYLTIAAIRRGEDVGIGLELTAILPAITAGTIAFPPAILLYEGIGVRVLPLVAAVIALILTPVVPLLGSLSGLRIKGMTLSRILIFATVLAGFASVVAPPYSVKAPERVNIHYWQDADSGKSQWVVHSASGRLPDTIRAVAAFHGIDNGPFPWEHGPAFVTDAPALTISAPTLTIIESTQLPGRQKYRALLRSERGAPEAMVLFPPDTESLENVRLDNQPLGSQTGRLSEYFGGWKVFRCVTMPPEGIEMAFVLGAGKAVNVEVADASYNLPVEGNFLQKARPLAATPSQDGDVTIVSRRVQLLP